MFHIKLRFMYHPEKGKGHAALTAHVATIGDAPLWVAGGFQFSEVPALPLVPGRWPFSVHLLPALWPVEVLPVSPHVSTFCCWVTKPQTLRPKTAHIYGVMVAVGQAC